AEAKRISPALLPTDPRSATRHSRFARKRRGLAPAGSPRGAPADALARSSLKHAPRELSSLFDAPCSPRPLEEYAMFEDAFEGYEFDEEMGDEEWAGQPEEIDDEVAEYLARELLEVGDEEELEEFLGSLLSSAAKAAGGFLRSNVGKKLVGAAKGLAKQTLPQVGAAVGGHFGGDTGRKLGQKLGGAAAARLELELEEDELEAAKRVVKTACAAAQKAVKTQG